MGMAEYQSHREKHAALAANAAAAAALAAADDTG